MNSREDILETLRANARPGALPPAWRSQRQFESLTARFQQALAAVHGEVVVAEDLPGALSRLGELLEQLQAKRIVMNDETPLGQVMQTRQDSRFEWHQADRHTDSCRICGRGWRGLCASADVGLSSAEAALAETGSLVITSGPGKSRLTTLLPPVHIALVPLAHMTTDLFTWMAGHDRRFPASTTLVSGPSKTADIEQTMAIGVHGPKQFFVILYRD